MNDMGQEELEDLKNLLALIERTYASDAYRTPGKSPVMNADLWASLQPYADQGFVELDESSAPLITIRGGKTMLGRGFVSLTDAGRALLPVRVTH